MQYIDARIAEMFCSSSLFTVEMIAIAILYRLLHGSTQMTLKIK